MRLSIRHVTAYDYADGAVSGERLVLCGLPDAKSPELRGAYSHALKSVAVAEDGTVYVAVGSTGNTFGLVVNLNKALV